MGKRILFVEDDRSLSILYHRVFSRMGYQVSLAAEGLEALVVLSQSPHDLVVVDVKLAGELDGLELLGKILLNHRIPSIINTAYARFQENFRSWSADAYVIKSSDLTELQEAVSRLLPLAVPFPEVSPPEADQRASMVPMVLPAAAAL